eukprot:gnl/TRDRNA2_/TRDRNA2_192078_c0_seq1.p1 gnl/TRDRNA2_/TRDRNA2_192078_c0~~gnl/TRDRNA2_/TRDRNA2_192078_c0_seq1.p1  ORF type:complete len:317 (+),score=56.66 gnl/TRDRNA2_/TRDRNA2_192078_c0_seq1:83-1033(+)
MHSILAGSDYGEGNGAKASECFRVVGGGRQHCVGRASSFSLGWSDGGTAEVDAHKIGKRIGGPMQLPSKGDYAMELRAQMAAKGGVHDLSQQQHWSHDSGVRQQQQQHWSQEECVPQRRAQHPSSFARLGGCMMDPSVKAAAYAADLKAQIDAKAATKAEVQRQRLANDIEDNAKPSLAEWLGGGKVDSWQKQRQAERQRMSEENADCLERFLNQQGGCSGYPSQQDRGHAPPAGQRLCRYEEPRSLPPRPPVKCPFDRFNDGAVPVENLNNKANRQNDDYGNVPSYVQNLNRAYERSSSKLNAPGGSSSFSLGWD